MTKKLKDYQIEVYHDFNEVKTIWLSLEKDCDHFVFQKYFWIKTWYDTIGKSENCIPSIFIINKDKKNLAIFPLCVKKFGFIKYLTWMGGVVTDYHAPLINSDLFEFDLNDFIIKLKRIIPRFHYIRFEKQPQLIKTRKNPFITKNCKLDQYNSYFSVIGNDWETYYQKKTNSKTRYNNRRNIKLLNESGVVDFIIANDDDCREKITNTMILHKIQKYESTKAKNLFSNEMYKNFYLYLSKLNNDENNLQVHISALVQNSHILSTHWGLFDKERFYYLMPTYIVNELSKYSPGKLLQMELMQWCIRHNINIFDFTVGDEEYKLDWCDSEVKMYKFFLATSFIGVLIHLIENIKDYIKNHEFLFRIAKKIKKLIII